MEKQMIKSVKTSDEKNGVFILNYYLTTEKHVYGVFVEKTTGGGVFIESERVNGVGCVRRHMLELITKLAEHTVTPISLCEVLDDLYEEDVEKMANKKSDIA